MTRTGLPLALLALAMLATACAGRNPAQTNFPAASPAPGYDPYNPGGGYSDPNGPGGGYSDPYGPGNGGAYDPNNPGGQPVNAVPPLVAQVTEMKNGVFLGMGTLKVSITVTNPASTPQAGMLRVSILDNGHAIKDYTERISVPPTQVISRNYTDKRWKADNVAVSVIPDPNGAMNPYDPNGGYNGGSGSYPYSGGSSGGAYDSTSGYPSSGGYPSGSGSYPY